MSTTNPTTTPAVPVPGGLTDGVTTAMTQKMIVDAYANAVVQQPPLNLPEVPNLDPHLATAKANATTWITTVAPSMITRITDIIGFGATWAAFSPAVQQKVQAGDTAGAVQLLQIMRDNHLVPMEANAQASAGAATALQLLLATDDGNLKADAATGASIYGTDGSLILQLQGDNEKLQDTMSNMMTQIGLSAVGIVVGGLIIAVGALAEIPTAGASTAIVVAGVLVVGGGIAGVATGAVSYNDALASYRANLQTIAQDQAEMAALTAMQGQVTSLMTANEAAQTALAALASSWTVIKGLFDDIILDLTSGIIAPAAILPELVTADGEWATLTSTATTLATNLGVPHVQVDLSQPAAAVVNDSQAA